MNDKDRQPLLRAMEVDLEEKIHNWVKENDILNMGEQVVFTLTIKKVPHVVNGTLDHFLDMTLEEFFSRKMVEAAGIEPKSKSIVRIYNSLVNTGIKPEVVTVRHLIGLDLRHHFRSTKNCGEGTLRVMDKVLKYYGVKY